MLVRYVERSLCSPTADTEKEYASAPTLLGEITTLS